MRNICYRMRLPLFGTHGMNLAYCYRLTKEDVHAMNLAFTFKSFLEEASKRFFYDKMYRELLFPQLWISQRRQFQEEP